MADTDAKAGLDNHAALEKQLAHLLRCLLVAVVPVHIYSSCERLDMRGERLLDVDRTQHCQVFGVGLG